MKHGNEENEPRKAGDGSKGNGPGIAPSFPWIMNPMEHRNDEVLSEAEEWLDGLQEQAVALGTAQGHARAGDQTAAEEAFSVIEVGINVWQKAFASSYAIAGAQAFGASLPADVITNNMINPVAAQRCEPVLMRLCGGEFALGIGALVESLVRRLGENARKNVLIRVATIVATTPGFSKHTNDALLEALCNGGRVEHRHEKYGKARVGLTQNFDGGALLDRSNPDNNLVAEAVYVVLRQLVRQEGSSVAGLFALMHPIYAVDHPDFLARHPKGAFDGFTLLMPAILVRECMGRPKAADLLLDTVRGCIEHAAGVGWGETPGPDKLRAGSLAEELSSMGLARTREMLYGGGLWRDALDRGMSMEDLAKANARRLLRLAIGARDDLERQGKGLPRSAQESLSCLEAKAAMNKIRQDAKVSMSTFGQLARIAANTVQMKGPSVSRKL